MCACDGIGPCILLLPSKESMRCIGLWMLLFLLLGHQIDGVNREVLHSTAQYDSVYEETLGGGVKNILTLYQDAADRLRGASAFVKRGDPSLSLPRLSNSVYSNVTLCGDWDSCVSRCGSKPKNLPYTCNCDDLCTTFSDCCADYGQQCIPEKSPSQLEGQLTNAVQHKCEILYSKYSVLAITQCPASYQNTVEKHLCSIRTPLECTFFDTFNESDEESVYQNCKGTVYNKCMKKLSLKCNEVVEPRCRSVLINHCKKHASSVCRKCRTRFWPVFDSTGIIYRNSHCAACNSHRNYTLLSPSILSQAFKEMESPSKIDFPLLVRRCAPNAVNSCPRHSDLRLQSLCSKHSGAVITTDKKRKLYQNLYCALCNGDEISSIACAPNAYIMRGLIKSVLDTFVTGDIDGMRLDDIPAAFSILLNFGLDGRQRMYFSSEGEDEMKRHQEKCGTGRIWDPFSQICRKLYCSTEFVLVDYRCVRKESSEAPFDAKNETSIIPDARAEFVHLSLSAEMEMLDFLQFNGLDIETICETVRESLASSFNINIDRLRNVRFNISVGFFGGLNETLEFLEEMDDMHPITFKIDFDLYEENSTDLKPLEPSVDSIVSMLASSLSMNGFEFDINNMTSRIFEIHQSVSPLDDWCAAEGQERKEYWNSDFSLTFSDEYSSINMSEIKGIYVNKTQKFYPKGMFIADILFQGYQFSGNLINVSGVAIVCDTKPKLNMSCIRILIEEHEYTLKNDSLFVLNESLRNVVDYSVYEEAYNGSVWVCLKSLRTDSGGKLYHIELDRPQALVSYVLLWISVIALTIVLITYVLFSSLRNLPGCNTMNLTLSLLAMQLTFIFGQRSNVTGYTCVAVGHVLHYEILCCFTWMSVMAFDLFRTFGNRDVLSTIRSKRKFLPRYMTYAYVTPGVIITVSSLLDYYTYESDLAPHYGAKNICWITNKYSALLFFAAPLALVMVANLSFFVLTILAMRSVKNVSQFSELKAKHNGKNDVLVYAKMAFVVGLTWALSFAAAFVEDSALIGQILTYLYIIFNTLQGFFILWAFVCNRKVYDLYKDALRGAVRKICKRARYNGSSVTIKRLANAMKRTTSTDTVISTVSNVSDLSGDSQLPSIAENGGRLEN